MEVMGGCDVDHRCGVCKKIPPACVGRGERGVCFVGSDAAGSASLDNSDLLICQEIEGETCKGDVPDLFGISKEIPILGEIKISGGIV